MEKEKFRTMDEPERLKKLPHYRGLPVTYTTLVDEQGIPHFKSTDTERVWTSKRDGKCSLCGEPLDYWKAFMVTEDEAKSQIIYENPNHEECLRYAFNVCPWLFYSKARYSETGYLENGMAIISAHPDREVSNKRPPKLGIYICNRYENIIHNRRYRVCKVSKAKRLEWIEGK